MLRAILFVALVFGFVCPAQAAEPVTLKTDSGDPRLQTKSYSDPDLPISQELVDKVAAFITNTNDGAGK